MASQATADVEQTFAAHENEFKDQQGTQLGKSDGQIAGQAFSLRNLTNCVVFLLDHCGPVSIENLTDCRVLVGPCNDGVLVRDCTNCVFGITTRQLSMLSCSDCNVFLHCSSEPRIEACYGISFARYNAPYPQLSEHMKAAGVDPDVNLWDKVADASQGSADYPEPHWGLTDDTDASQVWSFKSFLSQQDSAASAAAGAQQQTAAATAAAAGSGGAAQESGAKYREKMAEIRAKREALRDQEREAKEARRAAAEEAKEDFYHQRTNGLAQAAADHRADQVKAEEELDESIKAAEAQPWVRVGSLVEAPTVEDVERMWEVLVHLKSDPPAPRAGGAEAAD